MKKLYESGEVTYVDAAVVYERDLFAFRRGDAPAIEHEPYRGPEDPGPIVAAYCIVRLKNGETKREVMPLRDINRVRRRRSRRTREKSPWNKWPDQMAIKSVIKRIYQTTAEGAGARTPDRSRQPARIGRRARRGHHAGQPAASSAQRIARTITIRRPRWPTSQDRACPRREPGLPTATQSRWSNPPASTPR